MGDRAMDGPLERSLPSLIGRYEIVRLIGRGAMGRVFLAHDPVLTRRVAVKVLRDDLRLPAEQLNGLIERMRQEARASARISHPNIVALFDMGEAPDLGLYLVFEYAEGVTLKERLQRGPLPAGPASELAKQLGDALSTAHASGVLHRDIKPDNVILTSTGAKIADFGIARIPESTLTRDGGLLGTPAYSAPESVENSTFSPASDQFSMASTLYEAISGLRAFPGDDAVAVASRIANDEPSPIALARALNPEVDAVFRRAMSKNPSQRYESARDFGNALGQALMPGVRAPLATLPDQHHQALLGSEPPTGPRGRRFGMGGVAVGLLLGIAGMQLTSGLRQNEISDSSEGLRSKAASIPSVAYGWLAESPKPRMKPQPSAQKNATPRAEPRLDLEPARAANVDAGAPEPSVTAPAHRATEP
jgi:serine/threonine protein kinase